MKKHVIKFRVWDEKYNYFLGLREFTIRGNGNIHCFMREPYQHELRRQDSLILEEFTDLVDKSGKEIYQGDIVLLLGSKTNVNGKFVTNMGVVKFGQWTEGSRYSDSHYVGFYIEEKSFDHLDLIKWSLADLAAKRPTVGCGIKVVGNIHQNKNLLK